MIEYAMLEDGFLRVKTLEPITFQERNPKTGEIVSKTKTVEDQILDLPPEWKPLDLIDENAINKAEDGYMVTAIPYDAGDRISYRYEVVPDLQRMRKRIEDLKAQLSDSDYQVIKCYEASLMGAPLPYDISELHLSRQAIRDKINDLEESFKAKS